jgi:ArsR family transcriptional regulator, arsenate/arsenite/antimonite-responsive transcriptional repressor
MKTEAPSVKRLAGMFGALGHEVRLRIVRLLLAAHPGGLVVGELQHELDIPPSTLSHHLEALRHEGLVEQRREGKFLRYVADADTLSELLGFLYAECCTRSQIVPLSSLTMSDPRACSR